MPYSQHSYYFLLLCLGASLVVVYFIIKPFLIPLILAAVLAFLFQPVYRKFLVITRGRQGISAGASTVATIILVILPVAFLGTLILKESSELYHALTDGGSGSFVIMVEDTIERVRSTFLIPETFKLDIDQYLRQGLGVLVQNLGSIFSSFAKMFLSMFVFLMAFYFFLKDGRGLKDYFVLLSPLDDKDDEIIVSRLKLSISATIKGSLIIGLIQGILVGIGFAIFGIPNPVLWGSVAAVTALIPGVGTAIVILPAALFSFFAGDAFGGFGLLAWGVVAVGLIDNFLGPRLVGRGLKLHPLAVFLAVLGGLALFGPLGFILGPLALSVCLAFIDMYFSLRTK